MSAYRTSLFVGCIQPTRNRRRASTTWAPGDRGPAGGEGTSCSRGNMFDKRRPVSEFLDNPDNPGYVFLIERFVGLATPFSVVPRSLSLSTADVHNTDPK